MSDIRVPRQLDASNHVPRVATNGQGGRHAPGNEQHSHPRHEQPGAEELALALPETGRVALAAQLIQDVDGNPLIRIVDRERGETIAVVTPEALRELAEQTGLPKGLLVEMTS
jgi:hypothetical protein